MHFLSVTSTAWAARAAGAASIARRARAWTRRALAAAGRWLRDLCMGFGLGMLVLQPALANPLGGSVTAGSAEMAADGATLTVTNAPGTVIEWAGFSIAADEITRFVQENAASAVLNRVTGAALSEILGRLESNGQVFLINPNGIVVGNGATIDTAGFVASTLAMTDADFLAGRLRFAGAPGAGAVHNGGVVIAREGPVVIVAPVIENSGLVRADDGELLLAAGRSVLIADVANGDVAFEVQAPEDAVLNLGELIARGGSLRAFAGTLTSAGVVSADAVSVGAGGEIVLSASGDATLAAGSTTTADGDAGGGVTVRSGGTTWVEGTVSADGAAGAGGTVDLLGPQVGVAGSARVTADGSDGGGAIHVGGNYRGQGPLPNARAVYLGGGAALSASSTARGDGGEVVLWSDELTRGHGAIAARGTTGRGGFVETSSLGILDQRATPDIGSDSGLGGTWLLDPPELAIVAGTGVSGFIDVTNPTPPPDTVFRSTFFDNNTVGVDTLLAALTGGNTVRLETTASSGSGDIALQTELDFDGVGDATLQLLASSFDGDIIFEPDSGTGAGIRDSNLGTPDALTLDLRAPSPDGRVQIDADIDLSMGDFLATTGFSGGHVGFTRDASLRAGDIAIDRLTISGTFAQVLASGSFEVADQLTVVGDLTLQAGTGTILTRSLVLGADAVLHGSGDILQVADTVFFPSLGSVTLADIELQTGLLSTTIATPSILLTDNASLVLRGPTDIGGNPTFGSGTGTNSVTVLDNLVASFSDVVFGARLVNRGQVDVSAGTFTLNGGGANEGTIDLTFSEGAGVLVVQGATFELRDGSEITGTDPDTRTIVDAFGTLAIAPAASVRVDYIDLLGLGEIRFDSAAGIQSTLTGEELNWFGGDIAGVNPEALPLDLFAGFATLDVGELLRAPTGTAQLRDVQLVHAAGLGNTLLLQGDIGFDNAHLIAQGTVDFSSRGVSLNALSGPGAGCNCPLPATASTSLIVAGALLATAPGSLLASSVPIGVYGSVELIDSDIVLADGGFVEAGGTVELATSTFDVQGGTFLLLDGAFVDGALTVSGGGATVDVFDGATATASVIVDGGTLNLRNASALAGDVKLNTGTVNVPTAAIGTVLGRFETLDAPGARFAGGGGTLVFGDPGLTGLWEGSLVLQDITLRNLGGLVVSDAADLFDGGTGQNLFEHIGGLLTVDSGSVEFHVPFENTSAIEVSGFDGPAELVLFADSTLGGTIDLVNCSEGCDQIRLAAGTHLVPDNAGIHGPGPLLVDPGATAVVEGFVFIDQLGVAGRLEVADASGLGSSAIVGTGVIDLGAGAAVGTFDALLQGTLGGAADALFQADGTLTVGPNLAPLSIDALQLAVTATGAAAFNEDVLLSGGATLRLSGRTENLAAPTVLGNGDGLAIFSADGNPGNRVVIDGNTVTTTTGSGLETTVSAFLDLNGGQLRIGGDSLRLTGSSDLNGTVSAAGTGLLLLDGGTHAISPGADIGSATQVLNGAQLVLELQSGNVPLFADITFLNGSVFAAEPTDPLNAFGLTVAGTATFDAVVGSVVAALLPGSLTTFNRQVSVDDLIVDTALITGAGAINVDVDATLDAMSLDGINVDILGSGFLSGGTTLGDGAVIAVRNGADLQLDGATIEVGSPGAPALLVDAGGVLDAIGSPSSLSVPLVVNVGGDVNVNFTTLELNDGGTLGGRIDIFSGDVVLAGGMLTAQDGAVVTNFEDLSLVVEAGATFAVAAGATASVEAIELLGGTLSLAAASNLAVDFAYLETGLVTAPDDTGSVDIATVQMDAPFATGIAVTGAQVNVRGGSMTGALLLGNGALFDIEAGANTVLLSDSSHVRPNLNVVPLDVGGGLLFRVVSGTAATDFTGGPGLTVGSGVQFELFTGATLDIADNVVLQGTSQFNPGANVFVAEGRLLDLAFGEHTFFGGTVAGMGTLRVAAGADLVVDALANPQVFSLLLDGGRVRGGGMLDVFSLDFVSGSFEDAGTTNAGGILTIDDLGGGGTRRVTGGHALVFDPGAGGVGDWIGGNVSLGDGAVLRVASGTLNVNTSAASTALLDDFVGAAPRFVIDAGGTVTMQQTGDFFFHVPVEVAGLLAIPSDFNTGFFGGGTIAGDVLAFGGSGTVLFDFGTYTLLGNANLAYSGRGLDLLLLRGANFVVPAGATPSLAGAQFAAGSMAVGGVLTLAGGNWSGGTIAGPGEVAALGTFGINDEAALRALFTPGTVSRVLDGATLRVATGGSTDWRSRNIDLRNAAGIVVDAGGVLSLTAASSDVPVQASDGGGGGNRIAVAGVLNSAVEVDTDATFDVALDIAGGTVQSFTGNLVLNGGGDSSDATVVTQGGVVFAGGTHAFDGSSAFVSPFGDGATLLMGATLAVPGALSVDALTVAGGSVHVDGILLALTAGSGGGGLVVESGSFDGSGDVDVPGVVRFETAALKSIAGNLTFDIAGAGTWTAGDIQLAGNATLAASNGGHLDIDTAGATLRLGGGAPRLLASGAGDGGTIANVGGDTRIEVPVVVEAGGGIGRTGGHLVLAGGGSIAGSGAIDAGVVDGQSLDFDGGTFGLADGTTFAGTGVVRLLQGSLDVQADDLVGLGFTDFVLDAAGMLAARGNLFTNGPFTMAGGRIEGGGTGVVSVNSGGTFTGGPKALSGVLLAQNGSGIWNGGDIELSNGASFEIGGSLDVTGFLQVLQGPGAAGSFRETTFDTLNLVDADLTIHTSFQTFGLLQLDDSVLHLRGGGELAAPIALGGTEGASQLRLEAGSFLLDGVGVTSETAADRFVVDGAVAFVADETLSEADRFDLRAGSLQLGGINARFDVLAEATWTGGSIDGIAGDAGALRTSGDFTVGSGSPKALNQARIVQAGLGAIQDDFDIQGADALYEVQSGASVQLGSVTIGGNGRITVSGTLERLGGGVAQIAPRLAFAGGSGVLSNDLHLLDRGEFFGAFIDLQHPSVRLRLESGGVLGSSTGIGGPGSFELAAGTLDVFGESVFVSRLVASGGNVVLGLPSILFTDDLLLDGAGIDGRDGGTVVVQNDLFITADTLITDLPLLVLSGPDTGHWSAGDVTLAGGSTLRVDDGAVLNVTGEVSLIDGGGGSNLLDVAGTLNVVVGAVSNGIAIVNNGFEAPALADNAFTDNAIPGWTVTPLLPTNSLGVFNPPATFFPGEAPDGQNVAYIQTGAITQVLPDVLQPGTAYNLTVLVGDSLIDPVAGFAVELLAGGSLLATGATTTVDGAFVGLGVFAPAVPDGDPRIGQALSVRLVDLDADPISEVYFDQVFLQATRPGFAHLDVPVQVSGTLQTFSGVLDVGGSLTSTSGSQIDIGAATQLKVLGGADISGGLLVGGALDVVDSLFTVAGSGTVNGAGVARFAGATTATVDVPWHVAGNVFAGSDVAFGQGYAASSTELFPGADVRFDAASSTDFLGMSGGVLGGTGQFDVLHQFHWMGGDFTDGATTRIAAGVVDAQAVPGAAKRILGGRTLRNEATLAWNGGPLALESGGRLVNAGVLDVQDDVVAFTSADGTGLLQNESGATLQRVAGMLLTLDVALENGGDLDVAGGEVRVLRDGASDGLVDIGPTARLVVDGALFDFAADGGDLQNDGTLRLSNTAGAFVGGGSGSGTFDVDLPSDLTLGFFQFSDGAMLTGAGAVDIDAADVAGTLTVAGTDVGLRAATVTGTGTIVVTGALLVDEGTSTVNPLLDVRSGGVLGFVDDVGTGTALVATALDNAGLVLLSNDFTGPTAASLAVTGAFTNAAGGIIRAEAGTGGGSRTITGALVNAGTLAVDGTRLDFDGAGQAFANNGVIVLQGAGDVLAFTGVDDFDNAGNITLAGAGSRFEVAPGVDFDWTAGTLAGGATTTFDIGSNVDVLAGGLALNGGALLRTGNLRVTTGTFTAGGSVQVDDVAVDAGATLDATGGITTETGSIDGTLRGNAGITGTSFVGIRAAGRVEVMGGSASFVSLDNDGTLQVANASAAVGAGASTGRFEVASTGGLQLVNVLGDGAVLASFGGLEIFGGSVDGTVTVEGDGVELSGVALGGTGTFDVDGILGYRAVNTFAGTVLVNAGGSFGTRTDVDSSLVLGNLDNAGFVALSNRIAAPVAASLVVSGSFVNRAGATFAAEAGIVAGGGARSLTANVQNAGTFRVDGVALNPAGRVDSTGAVVVTGNGTLMLAAGTGSGSYDAAAGSTLVLDGVDLADGASLTGAGNLEIAGGSVGGTVTVAAADAALVDATLSGTGTLLVSGVLAAEGVNAFTGTVRVAAGGLFGSDDAADSAVTLGSLLNDGVVLLGNGGATPTSESLAVTGTFTNAAGGTIRAEAGTGGGTRVLSGALANAGVVIADGAALAIDGALANSGTLRAVAGADVDVQQGGSQSGVIDVDATSLVTLRASGGGYALLDGARIQGGGHVDAFALQVPAASLGALVAAGTTLNLFNTGTIGGAGILNVAGELYTDGAGNDFAGGTVNVLAGGEVEIAGGTSTNALSTGNLVNAGTVLLTGTQAFATDSLLTVTGTFINAAGGTIRAEAGTGGGNRLIEGRLVNNGALEVDGSLLSFGALGGDVTNAGNIRLIGAGDRIEFSGIDGFVNAGDIALDGAASVFSISEGVDFTWSAGTLSGTATSSFLVDADVSVTGAGLALAGGAGLAANTFTAGNGTFTNGGQLQAGALGVLAGATLDSPGALSVGTATVDGLLLARLGISASGAVAIGGSGELRLLNSAGSFGGAVDNAGTLSLVAASTTIASGTGAGTFDVDAGSDLAFSSYAFTGGATLSGAGGIDIDGASVAGTLTVAGDDVGLRAATVTGTGTLVVTGGLFVDNGTSDVAPGIVVQAGGQLGFFDDQGTGSVLNVASLSNAGDVILSNDFTGATAAALNVAGAFTNAAGGTIRAEAGMSGGSRTIAGALANAGALVADGVALLLDGGGAGIGNTGAITTLGTGTIAVQQVPTFTNAGNVALAGGSTFSHDAGTFAWQSGTLAGTATSTFDLDDVVVTGSVTLGQATILASDVTVQPGAALALASALAAGSLSVAAGATAGGTDAAVSIGAGGASIGGTLSLVGGAYTSAGVTSIAGTAGFDGTLLSLGGPLAVAGTLNLRGSSSLATAGGGSLTGTIDVGSLASLTLAGAAFDLGNGATISGAGAITLGNGLSVSGAALLAAGTDVDAMDVNIGGTGTLTIGGTLRTAGTTSFAGTFVLPGTGLLEVAGAAGSDTSLGGLDSAGLVRLGGGTSPAAAARLQVATLASAGTIVALAGGVRELDAAFTNDGVVRADGVTLALTAGSGTIVNEGTFDGVGSGGFTVASGDFTHRDTLTLGSGVFAVPSGTFRWEAGTITGGMLQAPNLVVTVANGNLAAGIDTDMLAVGAGNTLVLGGSSTADTVVVDGTLTVTGTLAAADTFTNNGVVNLAGTLSGALDNDGTLNITGNTTLDAGGGTATSGGSLNVAAGALLTIANATTFVIDGDVGLGAGASLSTSADVDILSGTLSGGALNLADVDVGGNAALSGVALAATALSVADGSTLAVTGGSVGGGATSVAGTLALTGGTLSATTLSVVGTLTSTAGAVTATGNATIDGDGSAQLAAFNVGGVLQVGDDGDGALTATTLSVAGGASVGGTSTLAANAATITGNLAVDGESSATFASSLAVTGNVAITNESVVTLAGTAGAAAFTIDASSELALAGAAVTGSINNSGDLTGTGTVNGNVLNSGVVAPGNSPGILNIVGDFVQTADGVLEIEVGGPPPLAPGVTFDQVNVSGTATLDGELAFVQIDGFDGLPGTGFVPLSFASSTGQFADVTFTGDADFTFPFAVGPDGVLAGEPPAPGDPEQEEGTVAGAIEELLDQVDEACNPEDDEEEDPEADNFGQHGVGCAGM
jgi:filamentous hemagglutinin family protein